MKINKMKLGTVVIAWLNILLFGVVAIMGFPAVGTPCLFIAGILFFQNATYSHLKHWRI